MFRMIIYSGRNNNSKLMKHCKRSNEENKLKQHDDNTRKMIYDEARRYRKNYPEEFEHIQQKY